MTANRFALCFAASSIFNAGRFEDMRVLFLAAFGVLAVLAVFGLARENALSASIARLDTLLSLHEQTQQAREHFERQQALYEARYVPLPPMTRNDVALTFETLAATYAAAVEELNADEAKRADSWLGHLHTLTTKYAEALTDHGSEAEAPNES